MKRYIIFIACILVMHDHLSMAMAKLKDKQIQVAQQSEKEARKKQALQEDIRRNLIGITEYKSYKEGEVTFTVAKGDITKLHVDAMVNAANNELAAGSGVCGAIYAKAGGQNLEQVVQNEVFAREPNLPKIQGKFRTGMVPVIGVGEARVTSIPKTDQNGQPTINNNAQQVKYVVHAVGPDCRVSEQKADWKNKLREAYRNSLLVVANKKDVKSIAFPAISTAIFDCPIEEAADIAISIILGQVIHTHIKHVIFIFLPNDKKNGYNLYNEKLPSHFY